MKHAFTFSVALFFTACAYNSGVVSMGNGEYIVSKQAASGFTGIAKLQVDARSEAGTFCAGLGKQLRILQTNDTQPPYILGNFPKAEITFVCD